MPTTIIASPLGPLTLEVSDRGLRSITWHSPDNPEPATRLRGSDDRLFTEVRRQLAAYFAGQLRQFDIPLDLQGTPFQLQAWQALQQIPYGETISYGEQARWIGNPSAVRAIGLANGRNPVPIIVPCHRVIGKSGRLTGYGGGLDRKRFLLELEHGKFTP